MQPLLLLGLTQLYIVVATYWSFGLDGAICVRTLHASAPAHCGTA
jgi:hypothetical protein